MSVTNIQPVSNASRSVPTHAPILQAPPPFSGTAALRFLVETLANRDKEMVPDGFKTVREWSVEFEKSRRHTHDLLETAARAGLMEEKTFTVRGRTMRFYRFAERAA